LSFKIKRISSDFHGQVEVSEAEMAKCRCCSVMFFTCNQVKVLPAFQLHMLDTRICISIVVFEQQLIESTRFVHPNRTQNWLPEPRRWILIC